MWVNNSTLLDLSRTRCSWWHMIKCKSICNPQHCERYKIVRSKFSGKVWTGWQQGHKENGEGTFTNPPIMEGFRSKFESILQSEAPIDGCDPVHQLAFSSPYGREVVGRHRTGYNGTTRSLFLDGLFSGREGEGGGSEKGPSQHMCLFTGTWGSYSMLVPVGVCVARQHKGAGKQLCSPRNFNPNICFLIRSTSSPSGRHFILHVGSTDRFF